jgi:mannose-6-phosphate isomerase-like protein (cupin superfamily)
MAKLINLKTIKNKKGLITILEKVLPFKIKRIYFIYDFRQNRGYHKHKKTKQALICLNGSCNIEVENKKKEIFKLNKKNQCLYLDPNDWHVIKGSQKTLVLVLASHYFNSSDYIYEK